MLAVMLSAYVVSPEQIARDEIFAAQGRGQLLGFYSSIVGEAVELDWMFAADAVQARALKTRFPSHVGSRQSVEGEACEDRVLPSILGFYERMGAQRVGVQRAAGRITWTRPVLQLELLGR